MEPVINQIIDLYLTQSMSKWLLSSILPFVAGISGGNYVPAMSGCFMRVFDLPGRNITFSTLQLKKGRFREIKKILKICGSTRIWTLILLIPISHV